MGGANSQLEDAFHNAIEPNYEVVKEKPWHRVAVFMYAQGKTFDEIGRSLGKTPVTVAQVLKQPWAQERLIRETTDAGRDIIEEIYKVHGPATLLEVLDLGKSARSESVKLSAKQYFLNRWLGMPNQPFTTEETASDKKTDAELAASVNRIIESLGSDHSQPNAESTSRPPGVPGSTAD